MGILSAFSIGALSAVLWKVAGAEDNSWFQLVHAQNKGQIIVASVFMAAAALQFYRQRSLLAYYYGEIAHARAMRRRKLSREWLEEANEWRTWINYRWGFYCAFMGVAGYILSLVRTELFRYCPQIVTSWLPEIAYVSFCAVCFAGWAGRGRAERMQN